MLMIMIMVNPVIARNCVLLLVKRLIKLNLLFWTRPCKYLWLCFTSNWSSLHVFKEVLCFFLKRTESVSISSSPSLSPSAVSKVSADAPRPKAKLATSHIEVPVDSSCHHSSMPLMSNLFAPTPNTSGIYDFTLSDDDELSKGLPRFPRGIKPATKKKADSSFVVASENYQVCWLAYKTL